MPFLRVTFVAAVQGVVPQVGELVVERDALGERVVDLALPLGHADADRIAYYRRPVRRHAPDTAFDIRGRKDLPRVDIAFSYAGADGTAIDAFVAAGAKGIVTASMLPGSSNQAQIDALNAAAKKGVVIAQSVRNGSGRLVKIRSGRPEVAVLADNLPPTKARILLMLALTKTADTADIQRLFDTY